MIYVCFYMSEDECFKGFDKFEREVKCYAVCTNFLIKGLCEGLPGRKRRLKLELWAPGRYFEQRDKLEY